jgi:hypothetical protein
MNWNFITAEKCFAIAKVVKVIHTGHTQTNGAVYMVYSIDTAPFFCVCPV